MAYGTVKVDNITFDNGGSDQNVTVSGLYRATTSGVTVSGTIVAATVSGVTIIGSTTVSGATVTGTTANFTSGNFSNIISSAATMSGALIMANQQQVRFREAVGNGVNHIALQAPAIVSADQTITLPDQTGTVVTTGDNGSVSSTMLAANLTISAAAGSAAAPSIAFTGDTNTGIYSPGADQLALSTAGNGRLFIDGNGLVGIGTVPAVGYGLDVLGLARLLTVGGASGLEIGTGTATNQFASLDLVGDATYTDYGLRLLRGNSGANAESNIAHKGTGALSLITEEAAPIVLATSNTERLRITSAGNVGIGTTSPGELLEVSATTDPKIQFTDVGNVISKIGISASTALTFEHNGAERLRIDASGNVGIGTSSPDSTLQVIAGAVAGFRVGYNNTSVNYYDADTQIFRAIDGSERIRIDSSGRVGIGTSSPGTALEVNGAAKASYSIASGGLSAFASSSGGLYTYFSSGASVIQSAADNSGTAAPLLFVSGSERLRIDSSGRVGIGTSSPTAGYLLDCRGNVKFGSSSTAGVYLGVDSNIPFVQGFDSGATYNQLKFLVGGTEAVRINSSGNVGIGTTSPTQLLSLAGTSANILLAGTSNSYTTYNIGASNVGYVGDANWIFAGSSSDFGIRATSNLVFGIGATERLRIDSSGKVGIGTSSLTAQLDVFSAGAVTNIIASRSSSTGQAYLSACGNGATPSVGSFDIIQDGTSIGYIYNRANQPIIFGTNNTERLRIDSSGRVGIGTSAPGTTLEVSAGGGSSPSLTGTGGNFAITQPSLLTSLEFGGYGSAPYGLWLQTKNKTGGSFPLILNPLAGNVGIGTTSPGTTLDIAGATGSSTTANLLTLRNQSASNAGNIAQMQFFCSNTFGGGEAVAAIQALNPNASANNGGALVLAVSSNGTATTPSERARIDSSGRLLVGTSTSRATVGLNASIQVETTNYNGVSIVQNSNNSSGSLLTLGKTRASAVGGSGIVSSGDELGAIFFVGDDSVDLDSRAAVIQAFVDGTPGANDMPGRLVFSTTADGSASPTERMRITKEGYFLYGTTTKNITSPNNPGFETVTQNTGGLGIYSNTTSDSVTSVIFQNPNGRVGFIDINSNSVIYATSSDYRLKENVAPIADGITRLQQLKPSRFNFISDPRQYQLMVSLLMKCRHSS
jgi:hypothetical protein